MTVLVLVFSLAACGGKEKTVSGVVVACGGEPYFFEVESEDGNYAFAVTENTKIVWEDKSAFSIWEDNAYEYDDWDVFSCDMEVEVIIGSETESIDPYIDDCVKGWFEAEKVTVKKVLDDYFAVSAKPVIYLYPEEETEVSVRLDYNGKLTTTYPEYENGWCVTAYPDGTLTDENGQEYNYLYWEGITDTEYDFSKGFCVKGEDTAEFLEWALSELGLTRREANEFIVYWLPLMEPNPYNIIAFQNDAYTENAVLTVTPAPDTVIRVFMAWKASGEAVEIKPQELTAPERVGFTVVEWGGTEVK